MSEFLARTSGGMRVDVAGALAPIVMDEPERAGGTEAGPTPMEALVASLAGCTAITLKLYAGRKAWPLEDVDVRVVFEPGERGGPNRFTQHVNLIGDLTDAQRERLMQIAGRCPVHRVLEAENEFHEVAAAAHGGV